ncbi:hypothetical protein [Streptomyces hoynatensis]|uniref:Uncharacterized protein n=1 Tax=Streptomyces hoynatensis TaxID=1141874 RepID=A0A3A9YF31_9ACTN|nr:hypothetical protein [Streptomyces hoynatensis]RKN35808.1 hypothetical protein D7294_30840 [Streptomyces hoynatensis]
MTAEEDPGAAAGRAVAGLAGLLAEELGGPPRLRELLDVLGWAAASLGPELAGEPEGPVLLRARLRRGAAEGGAAAGPSRAPEVGDATIVEAGDLLARFARRVAAAEGAPPSPARLVALLGRGLRQAPEGTLADVRPGDVSALGIAAVPRRKRAEPGDIVAIPARGGGHHLAVALERNVFGTALGLFTGVHPARPVSASRHPAVDPRPVYVGEEAVASGRWPVVGRDPGLCALWPPAPEIYHRPVADVPMPGIGPYGAAEKPDGTLRELGEAEAREVGVLDPGFHQLYLGTQLEQELDARTA